MASRAELQCTVHPCDSLTQLKFVVICSFYEGCYVLSRHKKRDTWETQGGHIEHGETPFDAAKRELFEESGITDADITYVCDYYGFDSDGAANGAVFRADIHRFGEMPDSEMKEVRCFDALPQALTYPLVTPVLMAEAEKTKHI